MSEKTQNTPPELKEIIEQLPKLLEKARDTRWKYILVLERWTREMSLWNDSADFRVIYGKADEVVLRKPEPGEEIRWIRLTEEVLLIPKTIPVLVLQETRIGQENPQVTQELYIFTSSGWKSVFLKL